MKDLIRFEPYYDSYIFSQNGKIYIIKELPDGDLSNCFIVNRVDKVIPYNGLTSPIKVQIQYTNRCNLKCPHCYVNSGMALSDEMKEEDIKTLLLELRDFGVLQIEWSGGEVFTRKNFLDMVIFARDLGFEQSVLTNGYAISKLSIEPSYLWKLFTSIQISINGFNKNFNKWVGKNIWDYVKLSVDNLYISKPVNSLLSITTTLDERNLEDLSLIAEWIDNKDIIWKLGKQILNGRSTLEEEKASELLYLSYGEILKLRSKFNLNLIHPYDKSEPINNLLPLEWNTEIGARWFMYIKANGDVYPFPYWDGRTEFIAGNVLRDSLDSIWYSNAFNFYRSASREKTKCIKCKLICQMWAKSFSSFDGDLFKIPKAHPNCPIDTFL